MKKSIFFVALLLLVFSCTKEEGLIDERLVEQELISDASNSDEATFRGDKGCDFRSIGVNNGMLEFRDFDHFLATVACLEELVEAHNDDFEAQYGHLTDDQIEAIEDKLGFEEFQPLIDFENDLKFSSRRAMIERGIVKWLQNPVLDHDNDPDDMDDLDEETRALLNTDGRVKIGRTVYDLTDTSDAEAEFKLNDGCKRIKKDKKTGTYDNGNKKYKIKVSAYSGVLRLRLKTKMVSYKKGGIFGWKRYRTKIYASVGGPVADNYCIGGIFAGAFKGPKKRKTLRAKYVEWLPDVWHKFQPNAISGYGWVKSSANETAIVLTW